MILPPFPLDEFLLRKNMGVDLPADFSGDIHQQTRQLSQSDITDDHEIDVAIGVFLLSGERTKYEGYLDAFFIAQGILDHIRQAARLEDEFTDRSVKRVGGICPVINTIPVLHPGDNIETMEFLEFRLHSADGKTGSSLNFTHMECCLWLNSKEIAKDLRSDF